MGPLGATCLRWGICPNFPRASRLVWYWLLCWACPSGSSRVVFSATPDPFPVDSPVPALGDMIVKRNKKHLLCARHSTGPSMYLFQTPDTPVSFPHPFAGEELKAQGGSAFCRRSHSMLEQSRKLHLSGSQSLARFHPSLLHRAVRDASWTLWVYTDTFLPDQGTVCLNHSN